MTMIETMLTVGLGTLVVLPMLAWAQLAWTQQASTFDRNVRGSALGLVRTYFVDDVTDADSAAVEGDGLVDCKGGDGADGSVLAVLGDGDARTVYTVAPDRDGTDGLWRRQCGSAGDTTSSTTLLVSDVLSKVTTITCDSLPTSVVPTAKSVAGDDPCGRLTLRITTSTLEQTSITATRRAVGATVEPPIAILSAEPTEGARPLVVRFSSDGSSDPKGGGITVSWDFGDGTTSTDAEVKHEYTTPGTFEVTLTVTDDRGISEQAATKVVVADNRPTAVIAAPAPGSTTYRGEVVAFSSKGSNDDLDAAWGGRIASYDWDFGDGTTSTEVDPLKAYAALSPPEGYTVTLTVTDDAGQKSSTQVALTVANRPPAVFVSAKPTSGTAPLKVELGAVVQDETTMAENPPLTYRWDFGDGRSSNEVQPGAVTYSTPGTWTLTLTVTDDQGAEGSASQQIVVTSAVLPAPTGLRETNSGKVDRNSRFIEMAWDRVAGAVRYQVYLACQSCDEVASGVETGTTMRITGLRKSSTKYYAWVRAQGADGTWGPWSDPEEVKS